MLSRTDTRVWKSPSVLEASMSRFVLGLAQRFRLTARKGRVETFAGSGKAHGQGGPNDAIDGRLPNPKAVGAEGPGYERATATRGVSGADATRIWWRADHWKSASLPMAEFFAFDSEVASRTEGAR
jgi:hypothetical protein